MNIAVIGAHNRGRISLLAHQPQRGFQLTAICDLSRDGLEAYTDTVGSPVSFTTDYRDIIADPAIDVVFVCSPDYLHTEHACAALGAGKHVFLEKPMAISIADCDRILDAQARSSARLYVGHNMRFFPSVQIMHRLIAEGRIGRVEAIWCRHFVSYGGDAYFKDWHSERTNSHGLLLQKGAHDIDVIHYLGEHIPAAWWEWESSASTIKSQIAGKPTNQDAPARSRPPGRRCHTLASAR